MKKRISTKECMKQAFKDMKKSGLHPCSLFKREKIIINLPEPVIRLGLFGI
jgi:hypothetical protein